jgi:hypothetical protein
VHPLESSHLILAATRIPGVILAGGNIGGHMFPPVGRSAREGEG